MSFEKASVISNGITVGKPLPFSVFTSDRKLLLSKGQIVDSERMRESLLKIGYFNSNETSSAVSATQSETQETSIENPLDAYVREFKAATAQVRVGIRMSREGASENYSCWVIGADEQHGLIVTAPANADRSFVPVSEGQTWIFRGMYFTAAVKFHGTIRKVQFDPVPLLHVSTPMQVELRHVRSSPRVATCLRGQIHVGRDIPILIVDVSNSGLGIAVDREQIDLTAGQRLTVSFMINMLGHDYNFKVPATVTGKNHELTKRYPLLWIAGLHIEAQSELEKLVLHSYLFEHLATELNPIWRTLIHT